jgi:hypothetical protein
MITSKFEDSSEYPQKKQNFQSPVKLGLLAAQHSRAE